MSTETEIHYAIRKGVAAHLDHNMTNAAFGLGDAIADALCGGYENPDWNDVAHEVADRFAVSSYRADLVTRWRELNANGEGMHLVRPDTDTLGYIMADVYAVAYEAFHAGLSVARAYEEDNSAPDDTMRF